MEKYLINFENVKNYDDFYDAIIKGLKFPGWCGKNPDAIYDLITGYMKYPATISVIGGNKLPKEFLGEFSLIKLVVHKAQDMLKESGFQIFVVYEDK